ncbi:MAG: SpoIIE family protein phosphatase, partial [Chlamydiia bacterium]|nr:SpoIIE family protein phosphatase [Chlamydiia bacterium]
VIKENNFFTLEVILSQKIDLVATTIDHEMELLAEVAFLLPKIPNPEAQFQEVARRDGVYALFHLKQGEKGDFYCDMSSKEELKGKDFTYLVKGAQKGIIFQVDHSIPVFYLIRHRKGSNEAWVISLLLTQLTKQFPIEKRMFQPSAISLMDHEGSVITSTQGGFVGGQLARPVGRTFSYKSEKYIGIEKDVLRTNFALLISAPEEVNFVEVPGFVLAIFGGLVLIVIIGGAVAFFLTKKMAQPMQQLTAAMDRVGTGDLSHRYEPVPLGFEINALGKIFNETVDSLNVNIEAAQKERLEKETFAKELKIGEEVQRSLLPKEFPSLPGVEIAARFIAAKEVGGDFYDFFAKDQLMLSIADTSGKGISACLYSLSVRSMLRSYAEIHESLDHIVKETNNLFCLDTGDTGMFVTAFIGFFDPKRKTFHYTNCGHLPALVQKKDGSIQTLTTEGMALGAIPFESVDTAEVQLEDGDALILYTDGVIEAHNKRLEMFGEERLISLLEHHRGKSPQELVDLVVEEVAFFAEGTPQHDDLTIVMLKV